LQVLLLLPLLAAVICAYAFRDQLFGLDTPIRVATAVAFVILGWALARDIGQVLAPTLFKRLDPGAAGTLGFLLRLTFLAVVVMVALRLAGLDPRTVAVGGAITAVVFGLAAQQTLGHLIAGLVLLSARPFKQGDQVRLQAGPLAGTLEGRVTSLGLLYTEIAHGEDRIQIPNSVVLSSAVSPLREPDAVDLRARFGPGVRPSQVQGVVEDGISVPTRESPEVALEEIDAGNVSVRVRATPVTATDGPRLADEVIAALAEATGEGVQPGSEREDGHPEPVGAGRRSDTYTAGD
jgi:small-conductance mechanosensitive channel